MDQNFTKTLQDWVNAQEKDYAEGAKLLLQLTNNKIMYQRLSVNPTGKTAREFIEGKLKHFLDFRLQQLTHEQVREMQNEVEEIVKSHTEFKESNPADDFKAGKRADHDTLPDEIKALYVENLDITHKMRELHLQLRKLSTASSTCPDSERYPFLKEIIALDKQLHANWYTYDHYVAGQDTTADTTETKAKAKKKKATTSGE